MLDAAQHLRPDCVITDPKSELEKLATGQVSLSRLDLPEDRGARSAVRSVRSRTRRELRRFARDLAAQPQTPRNQAQEFAVKFISMASAAEKAALSLGIREEKRAELTEIAGCLKIRMVSVVGGMAMDELRLKRKSLMN